jgi:hypothetical protein
MLIVPHIISQVSCSHQILSPYSSYFSLQQLLQHPSPLLKREPPFKEGEGNRQKEMSRNLIGFNHDFWHIRMCEKQKAIADYPIRTSDLSIALESKYKCCAVLLDNPLDTGTDSSLYHFSGHKQFSLSYL